MCPAEVLICLTGKDFTGPWGAPAMYALEGGSVGLQIGVEATDFVFAVMNDRGAGSLLRTKAKLGASVAAAPKGRSATADTDAHMRAEILSDSRARGVFPAYLWMARPCSPMKAQITAFTTIHKRSRDHHRIRCKRPPSARNLISAVQESSPQLTR